MKVIGIDPGLTTTAWAVLDQEGGLITLCSSGTITPPKNMTTNGKLHYIFHSLEQISKRFPLLSAAIENVFVNTNPKTSMFLCYARSAAILALMNNNIEIAEYQPTVIKRRVFGSGHADKAQVAYVVNTTLHLPQNTKHSLHETDAISIALCHLYSSKTTTF